MCGPHGYSGELMAEGTIETKMVHHPHAIKRSGGRSGQPSGTGREGGI